MRGTEKQIRWAEEIKAATLEAIDALIADGQNYIGNPKADALLVKLAAQREALEGCEYAGDVINCFMYVKASDPVEERCKMFASACKIKAPENDIQRKMLGDEVKK